MAMNEDSFASFLNSPSQQQAFPFFPDSLQDVEPSLNGHQGRFPGALNRYGESGHNMEWTAPNGPAPPLRTTESGQVNRAGKSYPKDLLGAKGTSKNTPLLKKFEAAASRVYVGR